MGVYSYKGINKQGKKVQGTLDADNIKSARGKLKKEGIFPTQLLAGESTGVGGIDFSRFFQGVKIEEIAHMTRQMATLLSANIPLIDTLTALTEQLENKILKNTISSIKEKVVEGGKLSDAMKEYPKIFGDLYISMVSAGEASGALDTVLLRLADFTENQANLKSKVKGALTYPIVMGIIGVLVLSFLMVSVVPKITKIFDDNDVDLPAVTNFLVGFSQFMQSYWWLAFFVIPILVFAFKKFAASKKGRYFLDAYKLKMPIFGEMFRMISISRFSRTLATLMSSGVPLVKALEILKDVVENVILSDVIEETKISVKEGESIAAPLKRSGQFPPAVIHMVNVGEKTGQLEPMLERVADNYDGQVNTKVSTLTQLLEPLMIVGMGAVVSFIVMAILLPILKMNQITR